MIDVAPACPKCSTDVLAGARFCPQCGVSLEAIGPGTVLNQWLVVAPLASGGMGTVFRGEHTRLKRAVCIKCIQPSLASDDSMIRRFEREATVLASIHHPNVVSVIDLGQLPNGGLFLVLELVEGKTLRDLIREGKLPVPRVIELARQILAGLEEVHQRGVVHRDLKPSNILLKTLRDGADVALLADFGIARAVADRDLTDSGLTKTGMVLGTPGYMAPEQILGEVADARSDIYAAGVLVHELLTGVRMFDADSGVEVLHRHLTAPAPPPLGPQFGALNDVVLRALAKKPGDRYQSAREFSEALVARAQRAPQPKLELEAAITQPESKLSPAAQAVVTKPSPAAPAPASRPTPGRQTPLGELIDLWKKSSATARAESAALLERRVAEWCGQGAPEPIVELLQQVRQRADPELDAMIRASLLERIGAVARMFSARADWAGVIRFIGPEGHARLVQSLRGVESPEIATLIARAIINGPPAPLLEALPHCRPAGVGAAVSAAGELSFNQARPLLVLALNHADALARLGALKQLKPDHAMQLVVEVRKRLSDKDTAVRIAAVGMLGHLEDRQSVPLISTFVRRSDASEGERAGGASALGEIGGADAAEALRAEFAREKSLEVKCAIASALGTIGDAASIEALRREGGRLLAPAQLKEICARFVRR